ncbi:hypothetical protein [Nocardia nova]|uniref:hypothetical protein n=1 Tax=Nocardia nova TaxID=37330 RepID=UPI0033DF4E32
MLSPVRLLVVAWAARRSDGRAGVWTVTEVRCASWCRSWGDFVPEGGGAIRRHIELVGRSELSSQDIGTQWSAIDLGAREHVYVPGGGRVRSVVWVFAALGALSLLWVATVAVTLFRLR